MFSVQLDSRRDSWNLSAILRTIVKRPKPSGQIEYLLASPLSKWTLRCAAHAVPCFKGQLSKWLG